MSIQIQLYRLIPIPSDPASLAKLPPDAIIVQLAAPVNQVGAQSPMAQPNRPAPKRQATQWSDPSPAMPPKSNPILVQPFQLPNPQPQHRNPLDESVPEEQPTLNAGPTISEPEGPQVPRTLQMRICSFMELGVLFLIFILAIISLSNPSTMVHRDMYPADTISVALGVPSIILVLFSIVLIVVLQFIGKTFYHERFVKKALWVAACLWIVGTIIHILIAVGMSIRHRKIMGSVGLGLGIGIIPVQIAGAIIGAKAVDRLL